jgi:hypothetical protein
MAARTCYPNPLLDLRYRQRLTPNKSTLHVN